MNDLQPFKAFAGYVGSLLGTFTCYCDWNSRRRGHRWGKFGETSGHQLSSDFRIFVVVFYIYRLNYPSICLSIYQSVYIFLSIHLSNFLAMKCLITGTTDLVLCLSTYLPIYLLSLKLSERVEKLLF